MIKELAFTLYRNNSTRSSLLFNDNNENDRPSYQIKGEHIDWRYELNYVLNSNDANSFGSDSNYIHNSKTGLTVIHGICYKGTTPYSAGAVASLIENEGINSISQLNGSFVLILFIEDVLYVVAPKTPGANVYISCINQSSKCEYQTEEIDNLITPTFHVVTDLRFLSNTDIQLRTDKPDEEEQFYEPGLTAFSGVRQLVAGHYLQLDLASKTRLSPLLFSYWQPCQKYTEDTAQSVSESLWRALEESIESISDCEIISLVSGGLDSSVVTALAARAGKKIIAYSIGTEESNEFKQAEFFARSIGIEFHKVFVTVDDLLLTYAKVVGLVGHPYSIYIEYLVPGYLAMKKVVSPGSTVLSGYGSDILFAGFATRDNTPTMIANLVNKEYRTALWSNETSHNLVDIDGVTVYYPYLNDKVVEIGMSISPKLKFNNGWEKWILRKSFESILPKEVAWRRKIGIHQTTGMEEYLSRYISRYCGNLVSRVGLRSAKDKFSLKILYHLVIDGYQPYDIDFNSICKSINK